MFGSLMILASGLVGERAEFGEFVAVSLRRGELFREGGEDATGERDVLQLDRHAGRADEGLDDRQQRIGRERRGFVDLRPYDFQI